MILLTQRLVITGLLLCTSFSLAAATLEGRIVDARTGEPISGAEIIATSTRQRTLSGETGVFTLTDLPAGNVEVLITVVGYGLVRKTARLESGAVTRLEIVLSQEAATRTDSVTVSAGPFEITASPASSEKSLSKSEIQALSMVLVGDPLRAAQALPGVMTNNDLRAELSVRGAGYEHVGVYVDGVLTDNFVHSAALGVGGASSSERASLSVINSETVGEMSLLSGAYPSRFGQSTAAVLDLTTRDGNFVRPGGRFATGVLSTSAVVDSPFADSKGSWLLAGRTSYADYLQRFVEKITGTGITEEDDSTRLNFSDLQIKVLYNWSSRHQLGFSAIEGIFTLDEQLAAGPRDPERIDRLRSENRLVNAHWRYTPSARMLTQTRVFALASDSVDRNRNDAILDDRNRTQAGFQSDLSYLLRSSQNIEAGAYVRTIGVRKLANGFRPAQPLESFVLEKFDERTSEQSYYLQDTWKLERISFTAGGRLEHSGLTGETLVMPRAALAFTPGSGWTVRAGAGSYAQFPDFRHVFGFFGSAAARAERAIHYNLAVERVFGTRTRMVAEIYSRQDRDHLFSLNEPRLAGGNIVGTALPYRNVLRGYARGAELSLQRRSANGLTGWISYAYSVARYEDRQDGLHFPSDFDQRHTVNMFGSYRLRPTVSVSGQWRYGSGFPRPGFFQEITGGLGLGPLRNTIRLPAYSRLDLRANKAFLFRRWKLTLSGEVLNVLNRENVFSTSTDPLRFPTSGRFSSALENSLGVLPALAVAIEF